MRPRLAAPDDPGFTLIEIALAVVVTAALTTAVGVVLFTTQRTLSTTSAAIQRSRNTQLATLLVAADVRSADPGTGDVDTSGLLRAIGCGDGAAAGSQPLTIAVTDIADGSPRLIAYRLESSTLTRYMCHAGNLTVTIVAKRVTAATATTAGRRITLQLATEVDQPIEVTALRPAVTP